MVSSAEGPGSNLTWSNSFKFDQAFEDQNNMYLSYSNKTRRIALVPIFSIISLKIF